MKKLPSDVATCPDLSKPEPDNDDQPASNEQVQLLLWLLKRRRRWLEKLAIGLFVAALSPSLAHATLIDLHNGLILDSANSIYWTQNGSLFPSAPWAQQVASVAAFTLAGLSDYRLPTVFETTNLYNQLVALGVCTEQGPFVAPNCAGNRGPFINVGPEYWTSTTPFGPNPGAAEFANFAFGYHTLEFTSFPIAGWAVHGVSEPGSLWLIFTGLSLIAASKIRLR